MIEEWRPVQGWAAYEVSDMGRVRRVTPANGGVSGQMLKPRPTHKGYVRVALHQNRVRRDAHIHTLVAQAFLGDAPSDNSQVDHLDGNKLNNAATNLEWVTPLENSRRAIANGLTRALVGIEHPEAKLSEDQVRAIRTARGIRKQKDLAAEYGVARSLIWAIQTRRAWRHVS